LGKPQRSPFSLAGYSGRGICGGMEEKGDGNKREGVVIDREGK